MKRIAVLVVFAAILGACGRSGQPTKGEGQSAGGEGTLSADGVVADVKESSVQVRTGDGRTLDFALDDDVKVTLGGGESQPAVITEGAPVRVSYKPKDAGQQDLVAIDVEPRTGDAKGDAASPGAASVPDRAPAAGSGGR